VAQLAINQTAPERVGERRRWQGWHTYDLSSAERGHVAAPDGVAPLGSDRRVRACGHVVLSSSA
jgi:hypothetical protein